MTAPKPQNRSFVALLFCVVFILGTHAYYPKWQMAKTEATISWDVSGYYFYLPALFIYKDLRKVEFRDSIVQQYEMSSGGYQAYDHESGNRVMKYSAGMSLQYLPFFAIAHSVATFSGYPADGFSRPYQMAISFGSLLMAFLGLFYLRKSLLRYFSDTATALTLVLIVAATNYLNYSAIDNAMTHNWLFTLYALLIWQSIRFYERPASWRAWCIGATVGLMALTRPTEIIAILIPLLWGLEGSNPLPERLQFFLSNRRGLKFLLLAGLGVAILGSIQLIYWKYVAGEWLVYSYQDQGFSWLRPHLWQGFFSGKGGWLIYSPTMILSLVGFIALWRKQRPLFPAIAIFTCLFIYITFAWDIWWYGGSLGQRAMVQSYAVLAFPMAALIQSAWKQRALKIGIITFGLVCIYYNVWLTHQAHKGGLFVTEQMTLPYLKAIFLRSEVPEETIKLLDTKELYSGTPNIIKSLAYLDFESDSLAHDCPIPPIEGDRSLCLSEDTQFSPPIHIPASEIATPWIRVEGDFRCQEKEWEYWLMAQLMVKFKKGDEEIQTRFLRLFRLLPPNSTKTLFLDVPVPNKQYDQLEVQFWQSNGKKPLAIDRLKVLAIE